MLEQPTTSCRLLVRKEVSGVPFFLLNCFFTSSIFLYESFSNGFVIINFKAITLPKFANCIDCDGWICAEG